MSKQDRDTRAGHSGGWRTSARQCGCGRRWESERPPTRVFVGKLVERCAVEPEFYVRDMLTL